MKFDPKLTAYDVSDDIFPLRFTIKLSLTTGKTYSMCLKSTVGLLGQDGNVQVVSLLFSALLTPSLDCLSVFSAQALAAVKFDGASF